MSSSKGSSSPSPPRLPPRPEPTRRRSAQHRARSSVTKTEVIIHIYDLLPPGRLSSFLWTIGGSLLHSGVVVKGKEYAYGGHNKKGVSGVYWTRPKLEPPGGTFRCAILQGFSFLPEDEIDTIIQEASHKFQGTSYNLLTQNCNHFTSYLVAALTNKPAPPWLNRAASIGLALPCVVPREWIAPPEYDTVDGELVDEESDESDDENAAMLRRESKSRDHVTVANGAWDSDRSSGSTPRVTQNVIHPEPEGPRLVSLKDTSGREMPSSERAPLPKRFSS